jgi:hypothetical protein
MPRLFNSQRRSSSLVCVAPAGPHCAGIHRDDGRAEVLPLCPDPLHVSLRPRGDSCPRYGCCSVQLRLALGLDVSERGQQRDSGLCSHGPRCNRPTRRTRIDPLPPPPPMLPRAANGRLPAHSPPTCPPPLPPRLPPRFSSWPPEAHEYFGLSVPSADGTWVFQGPRVAMAIHDDASFHVRGHLSLRVALHLRVMNEHGTTVGFRRLAAPARLSLDLAVGVQAARPMLVPSGGMLWPGC